MDNYLKPGKLLFSRSATIKTPSTTLSYQAKKTSQFVSVYIGAFNKDYYPEFAEVEMILNSIGWFSSDCIIEHLGTKAWGKLCSKLTKAMKAKDKRKLKDEGRIGG